MPRRDPRQHIRELEERNCLRKAASNAQITSPTSRVTSGLCCLRRERSATPHAATSISATTARSRRSTRRSRATPAALRRPPPPVGLEPLSIATAAGGTLPLRPCTSWPPMACWLPPLALRPTRTRTRTRTTPTPTARSGWWPASATPTRPPPPTTTRRSSTTTRRARRRAAAALQGSASGSPLRAAAGGERGDRPSRAHVRPPRRTTATPRAPARSTRRCA